MALTIKAKKECRWDLVSLGEVMVRFDPGERRIATARSFEVCEGGGEYNVARGLKRCFGLDTAVVTAFADDPVGRLLQDLIYQGGVDQSRSEEHTSELQSQFHLVCRLLLEKKKKEKTLKQSHTRLNNDYY